MSSCAGLVVFAVEIETGDVYTLPGTDAVRAFIEEFEDILDADFVLVDASGRRVTFEPSFLLGDDAAMSTHEGQEELLRAALAGRARERVASLALLADALSGILAAEEDASTIIAALPVSLHVDSVDVLANVEHFLSDADIRRSDADYKRMQEHQMRELIESLRSAASREKLLAYTFLELR